MNTIQRTMFEGAKAEKYRHKIPSHVKQAIVTFKKSKANPQLCDVVAYILKRYGVTVSISHCCKILNNAGIRDERQRRRQESGEEQVVYIRPPFDPKKVVRCLHCRCKGYESKAWPGRCFVCALRTGKVKVVGELEVQEELFS